MAEVKLKEIRQQLREMTEADLHHEIAANRAALYDFRRQNSMRQLKDTAAIRRARRQIARALTILREREIAAKGGAK